LKDLEDCLHVSRRTIFKWKSEGRIEFAKSQAIRIGKIKEIDIADRTVTDYLRRLVNVGHLEQPKHGIYRKVTIEKVQESKPDENENEQ